MAKLAIFVTSLVFCGFVLFGVRDFNEQAERAGQRFAQFKLSDWHSSFTSRGFEAGRLHLAQIRTLVPMARAPEPVAAAQMPQDIGNRLRAHLPRPASHWYVTEWTAAHDYLFTGLTGGLTNDQIKGMGPSWALSRSQQFLRLNRLWPAIPEPSMVAQRQVYQRYGWAIGVTVDMAKYRIPGVADSTSGDSAAPVHSVHHGVAFRDVTELSSVGDGTRVLRARIGDGLDITVHSNASDRAIRYVLSRIDYAALNRRQENPAGGIYAGSGRHGQMVAQMRRDAPRLARLKANRRDVTQRTLETRVRQAQVLKGIASRICLDHDGRQYCKDIET